MISGTPIWRTATGPVTVISQHQTTLRLANDRFNQLTLTVDTVDIANRNGIRVVGQRGEGTKWLLAEPPI